MFLLVFALLCFCLFLLPLLFVGEKKGREEGAAEVVIVVATTKVAEEAMEIEEVAAVSC